MAPAVVGVEVDLADVQALSLRTAVAIGKRGTSFAQRMGNDGRAYELDSLRVDSLDRIGPYLYDVTFTDDRVGWVVGDHGLILATQDGGVSWERLDMDDGAVSAAVRFVDAQNGWVTDWGMVYRTADGGRNWIPERMPRRSGILQALGSGGRNQVAVGWDGIILTLGARDSVWSRRRSPTDADLHDVRFISADTGWAVGADGTLLSTVDGGSQWRIERSGVTTDLFGLAGAGDRVWAVGKGVVLRREDGEWRRVGVPGATWPAQWYYLSWLVVAGLVYFSARPAKRRDPVERVEEILVSDRPVDSSARDRLALNTLALAISRFLRNENTNPPLTVSVTGPWGSGKTSLMSLIRADLRAYGFRSVWFNAWHHQTEEHLLAALLENVRAQAVPSIFRGGLGFRLRLLWLRTRRLRPVAVVAFLAFFFYAGYLLGDPDRARQVWDAISSPQTQAAVDAAREQGWDAALLARLRALFPDAESGFTSFKVLFGLVCVVVAVLRSMKAFGVNPASLLASVSDRSRLRDLEAQTSFRHRFAREFEEVTEALKPRDLVIFVDDLDRCRPKNVLEVLEGINFLFSSGHCVIVMGMETERVIRCVGLGFKDEAEELLDRATDPDAAEEAAGADADRRKRGEFARQYLEKLVNIEVPVPRPGSAQFVRLVLDEPEPASPQGRLQRAWSGARRYVPAGIAAVLALVAFAAGNWGLRPTAAQPAALVPDTVAVVAAAVADTTPANDTTTIAAAAPRDRPGAVVAAPRAGRSSAALMGGVLLAVAVGAITLLRRRDPVVRDSPKFKQALAAWSPYVTTQRVTPRAVKKYLNRVRYYAMRERAQEPTLPLSQRLLHRILGRTWVPAVLDGAIPDPVLVALAALHECTPGELAKEETYVRFGESMLTAASTAGVPTGPIERLDYPPGVPLEYRERFLALAADIRVGVSDPPARRPPATVAAAASPRSRR